MYGSLPEAEAARERPARHSRPLWGSMLVAGLALAVVCVVFSVESGKQAVMLQSADDEISSSQAGLLGRVGQNSENTIGDLATVANTMQHMHAAHKVAHSQKQQQPANPMHDALVYRQKALQLLEAKKKLQQEEKRIDVQTRAETAAYLNAMHKAQGKVAPKHAAPAPSNSQTASVAQQVASMVLETIEPELNAQREEIAKLSQKSGVKHHTHVKEHYPAAFPAHFTHPKPSAHAQKHVVKKVAEEKKKGDTSFAAALQKFLGQTGVANRVHGHQMKMEDYNLDSGREDPGQGAEPEGDEPKWLHPEAKGGPCSVAGKCNHGRTDQMQGPEYWAAHKLARFKDEDDKKDDKKDDEEVNLGNEVLMRSLDDFVPPNDAYLHNLLTSGAYGIDHFGKLAPMSKENQILMYGVGMPEDKERILGKVLNTPGKGGAHSDEYDERRSPLGEDQIGDDDVEIPTALSKPPFPTEDYDHFDHWAYDSPENQELLNGIYWKRLKKDGFMDRVLDSDEAHSQQMGDGHDTKPFPDFALGSWHQGFGYGATKEQPEPFIRAREEVHGKDWREHVFTGTDENMEKHQGVVENMEKDGAYFKTSNHPILHRIH